MEQDPSHQLPDPQSGFRRIFDKILIGLGGMYDPALALQLSQEQENKNPEQLIADLRDDAKTEKIIQSWARGK